MTNNECFNCMYAIDGVCRLAITDAPKESECPHKDGTQATLSVC